MGPAALVRGRRERQLGRVLGALRLRERHLDSGGGGQLEPRRGAELGLCRGGIRRQLWVFGAEFLARGECDGCEDESRLGAGGGGDACWVGDCD